MPALPEMVREAGVVGAGGAGFPTAVKLAAKVKKLLINGAECELLMTVDGWLLLNEQEKLLRGLQILIDHFLPEETYLCIKSKRKEQVEIWSELLPSVGAKLFLLDDFYPAGDEQILLYEVTREVIPSGGIPLDRDAVVINVETLLNIEKATRGEPVTEKYVTLAGLINRPGTYLAPVGISYRRLLEEAGGLITEECRCIDGGPMMGRIIDDLDNPITKATKGLMVLPGEAGFLKKKTYPWEVILKQSKNNCEICRMCTDLCPRYLLGHPIEPHKVMVSNIFSGKHPAGLLSEATLCVECGVCQNFSCPVDLAPMTVIQEMKRLLQQSELSYLKDSGRTTVKTAREWRRLSYRRLLQRMNLERFEIKDGYFRAIAADSVDQVVHLVLPPIGAAGDPVVEAGDRVTKGDLLIDLPEGKLGSKTHASISGIVTAATAKNIVIRRE